MKTLLMARLRVMDFKKNSAQKGALQKYEEFMSYARRTSPNSYAETDDVMHNTLGCILGYILVKGSGLMVKTSK